MSHGTVYHNFIDGAWVASVSGDLFENRNPAEHDDLIGVFQKSTRQRRRARDRCRAPRATSTGGWCRRPAARRSCFAPRSCIAERKEALARDMTREMGKVLDETRGDVQEAIDMTFFMAGEGRRQYGQTAPSELRDKFAMSVRQPLGVCAVITPWNFPMAIPSWKIIPALVCGNTVVFKPATLTPLSALNFVKILEEAGIPAGVVNLVTGGGGEVGDAMLVQRRRARRVVHRIDRRRPNGRRNGRRRRSRKSISRWAARTSSWSWTTRISSWRSKAACGAASARPGSAARRRAASSCTSRCTERSSSASSRAPRALRVGDGLDPDTQMGPVDQRRPARDGHEVRRDRRQEGARLVVRRASR